MSALAIVNLVVFAALLSFLFQLSKRGFGFSKLVLIGLVLGTLFGTYLQVIFGPGHEVSQETIEWTNVVANSFVNLLRMIIIPLILVTMIAAVLKVDEIKSLGKIGGSVVAILVFTTMISAVVGIVMASATGLDATEFNLGEREAARAELLESRQDSVADLSIPQLLTSMVSTNIFRDLSQDRSISIIAVVIFGLFFGISALLVGQEDRAHGERIRGFIETTQAVVMRLVKIVMSLTPYGVLALMTRVMSTSDVDAIVTLISFVIASYIAIAIMFAIHPFMIGLLGANLKSYFQKVWPVLTFAFVTRSSAATIPLTIRAQIEELKVPAPIANISASFGATIGQKGCAGIYPAMLAVMVAPSVGVEVDLGFIAYLVLVIAMLHSASPVLVVEQLMLPWWFYPSWDYLLR
ncbi:MAG: L-cystine transporter tcyP [Gammaproteobacteria bacterium]|nr:MAG: L-cystine transporter tcyP [Gammaproteobacteria bacterium]